MFEKKHPHLLENQNLIYREADGNKLKIENFSICSTVEIQSLNLNKRNNQLMKLDFIKIFPVLCFIFNFLAFMCCEYEVNKEIKIIMHNRA